MEWENLWHKFTTKTRTFFGSKHETSINNNSLCAAILDGNISNVLACIKAGDDPNIRDINGAPALMIATITGNNPIAELLIQYGADVNARATRDEYTSLMFAATTGNRSLVKILINHGANPNLQDTGHMTALHYACIEGEFRIVEDLLLFNALPDVVTKRGLSPLIIACNEGNIPVAQALINGGAQVNLKGPGNYTALMCAAAQGSLPLVSLLLNAGADRNALNNDLINATTIAHQAQKYDIVQLLE